MTFSERRIKKKKKSNKFMKILLDVGHAKSTIGKWMIDPETGEIFYEYLSNRLIGKKVYDGLKERGIDVIYVVDPDLEYDTPISERANIANKYVKKYGKDNCLYLSLHSNACGTGKEWNSARGWCIYTTKGETKSDKIATVFYQEAEKVFPQYGMTLRKDMSDGDPDYEANFTVIYKTICPAVLIEAFFFTNKIDQEFLKSEVGQQECANVCIRAIERIIKNDY